MGSTKLLKNAMASKFDQGKLMLLRREARKALLTYRKLTSHLDCGDALARHMCSPDAAEAANDFNKAMDGIAKLDPACPKGRL